MASISSPTSPVSDPDVLVRVEGVSKKFCLSLKKSLWYGLKDMGNELVGRRHGGHGGLRPKEFWAVHDVGFEVKRGECLGLIGRNGAGKTTLLKMLNGLIKPDAGRIEMRGRVGALISLGAGFNPILTGRENIHVNASVLGLSRREIDAKMEEIIDFAEIGDFLDTPVQNYSSGMAVRLGFAVASSLEPDVLLLDEVLAVGDTRFRAKCYNRIGKLLSRAAVIFVTHEMNYIGRICNSVMLLNRGRMTFQGEPAAGIAAYETDNRGREADLSATCQIWEDGLQIHAIRMDPPRIHSGEPVVAVVEYTAVRDRDVRYLRCNFTNESRVLLADYDSSVFGHRYELRQGTHQIRIPLGALPLSRGKYYFNLAAFDESRKVTLFHAIDQQCLEVASSMVTTSVMELGRLV